MHFQALKGRNISARGAAPRTIGTTNKSLHKNIPSFLGFLIVPHHLAQGYTLC